RIQSGRDNPGRCRRKTEESDQADRESMARVAPREQPEGERDEAKACGDYHCGDGRRGHEPPNLSAISACGAIAAGRYRGRAWAVGAVGLLDRCRTCTVPMFTFTGYCV